MASNIDLLKEVWGVRRTTGEPYYWTGQATELDQRLPALFEAGEVQISVNNEPHFEWPTDATRIAVVVSPDIYENLFFGKVARAVKKTKPPKPAPAIPLVVMRSINGRRGQTKFRKKLFRLYENFCAVTGECDPEVLEAAHIRPHSQKEDYDPTNGLLLRSDIHVLFDLKLLAFVRGDAPDDALKVIVSPTIGTPYSKYAGEPARFAPGKECKANKDALRERLQEFIEHTAGLTAATPPQMLAQPIDQGQQ